MFELAAVGTIAAAVRDPTTRRSILQIVPTGPTGVQIYEHSNLGIPIKIRDEIMAKIVTASEVLLYVPNLIGYARVLCAVSSFLLMMCAPGTWLLASLLYLANFVGDLVDGWAARKVNQCSSFGGVLDMVTDRCSTAGLLFVLAGEYTATDAAMRFPVYRISFLALMLLDISSHWVQMHSSLAVGAHHKSAEGNKNKNFLVRWFYQYYWFFGYLCVGAEFTYILLYVLLRMPGNGGLIQTALKALLMACAPGCLAKQAVNVAQLSSSCRAIAQHDAEVANKANN
jgi:CDP-diacylglycerol--inositol 3-phosphatidyltransferase